MPTPGKGMLFSPVIGIIVALVGISIIIAIWDERIKGKAEEYGDSFGDAANRGSWRSEESYPTTTNVIS